MCGCVCVCRVKIDGRRSVFRKGGACNFTRSYFRVVLFLSRRLYELFFNLGEAFPFFLLLFNGWIWKDAVFAQ